MKLFCNWLYLKFRRIEPFLIPFIIYFLLTVFIPAILLISYSFKSIAAPQWEKFTGNIFSSLLLSFIVAILSLILTLSIAFPFAVLIWYFFSPKAKKKIFLLLAFPLISNYFVKLIGLKSCFDFFYGSLNSTHGFGYTIIGLVYLSLPLAIYNFVNTLSSCPKEKLWAIRDLGQTFWGEFFFLLLPWSKGTFCSSSILFFLPSLFTTFISEFLNHENSSQMIGEVISSISSLTSSDQPSNVFISFLVSVLFTIILSIMGFALLCFKSCKAGYKRGRKRLQQKTKREYLKARAEANFCLPLLNS